MSKRLLVMAGGTGGHVFPGLAVADYLHEQGWQIHWLGTAEKMEAKVVPNAGYTIDFLSVSGVRGNGLMRLLKAPLMIIMAIWQARRVLKRFKPDVVLGMGGFASGPGGLAAWLSGIPLVVHEQNAVPGMTNKMLSPLAKHVLSGFPGAFAIENDKYRVVGNPLRNQFKQVEKTSHQAIRVLVVGGSLGAKALNDHLPKLFAQFSGLEIRHQAGAGKAAAVQTAYQQEVGAKHQWQVQEFIEDMGQAYAWADLVICRAGALTVAEVAASGTAAVFVPLPQAVDDHQTKNALVLVNAGAALLAPQASLSSDTFTKAIKQLLDSPTKLKQMGEAAKGAAKPEATADVAECCRQLAETRQ
ncbi:undecaprenyldiphospho-muramoylpentapeptide beta-N-acetylglucosaminyltransferase [Aliiglaciecola sp. CAU 1673]|uniref:undecaprenyldiphospho-muramoylpentapeptide beta-N-acetylglucosaminyltransferase n=1 Tax=Aliiglaciecola sp. CAU 1673 TaxID=3032595 RepID=UPI0023DC7586|nr:undecaprenyldiphospho-muramoylpentapeptide beta-N-acetylglucosaminyltransferase [Aliiglaciecola sp. CAU 1673]MDF2178432.1 undecaprenyldiphospho-muramoylpentapeptide beta-N-acetylglucosaminyltransferase [Aliiglaciecola sp. CAU 1673]